MPSIQADASGSKTAAVTATGQSGAVGVYAESDSGKGVYARSTSGPGIMAESTSGPGAEVYSYKATGIVVSAGFAPLPTTQPSSLLAAHQTALSTVGTGWMGPFAWLPGSNH